MRKFYLLGIFLYISSALALAQTPTPTIETFTSEMERKEGFLPFYWDAKKGKIWLEINQLNTELLYYPTLAQGVGSNDIGLDRGRLGEAHIIRFERVGPKVLMVEPNYRYRALSPDPLERKAVEESFARSIHWGFEVAAESYGRVLVDLTPFLMQDAVGAAQDISQTKQGNYRLDASRSAMYLERTKNFPKNTEFETIITLVGDNAGNYLRSVVPSTAAVSMHQHHSFVELPDSGYTPRMFDPRAGVNGLEFYDYASPVGEPLAKRYLVRHRLQKKDPTAAMSEAVEPLVYYLDPGTPEPIRSALLEGASWWNQAFEAAGFIDGFQVQMLPDTADPMDIRYNVIQWVHRSTRGWSYGASIIDPRTGEILKGKVTLGSLRVRQDFLIAQGLVAKYEEGQPVSDEMMQLSLARLRQLSAHEIGHTLGLPHNYVASVSDRSSVMDYPHPHVEIKNDSTLDLSNAYATGIGEWDKVAINYAYSDFPEGVNEKDSLNQIITAYLQRGLGFLSDQDARPASSAHPKTHLWDGGSNVVDELERVMKVRQIALSQFKENKIPVGMPLATLEEVLVPMYLFHRYQVEAASKIVGGATYTYALRGDGQTIYKPVEGGEQRRALRTLLASIRPDVLALPRPVLVLIPPRPFGYSANPREVFARRTGLTFDPLAPAEAATNLVLSLVLNAERASRLEAQRAVDTSLPGLGEVIDGLIDETWKNKTPTRESYQAAIRRQIEQLILQYLIGLAETTNTSPAARAMAQFKINDLKTWIDQKQYGVDEQHRAHYQFALRRIELFEKGESQNFPVLKINPVPDGAPIDPGQEWLEPVCGWEE
ncbi:zinc-dependent metalloprotease [Telluribacter humicola]|uniref:zinc-dependent metalloprotease n=1 Tax=Telluribacter humicola TaxID=1720261 RepID=UPI001A95DD71|nr:zinc-dependent metalloprotease [Telluribacter humicola]